MTPAAKLAGPRFQVLQKRCTCGFMVDMQVTDAVQCTCPRCGTVVYEGPGWKAWQARQAQRPRQLEPDPAELEQQRDRYHDGEKAELEHERSG